jgi:hypothetical protein
MLSTGGGLFRAKAVTFNREAQQLVNHCPGGFQGALGTGRTRRFGIQNRRFCEETLIYFCGTRPLNREQYLDHRRWMAGSTCQMHGSNS